MAASRNRRDVSMGRVPVREGHGAADVAPLDDREVAEQRTLGALDRESAARCSDLADQLPELPEVPFAAGGRDQPALGPKYPPNLPEGLVNVPRVVQHPGGHR